MRVNQGFLSVLGTHYHLVVKVHYASGKKMNADHYKATYGGDVKGVGEKLSYIKDLGCTGIYLNPLNLSYNAIGYGVMNNYMLDSQYTTENEYKQFVNSAHNNDMRVMFDVLAHSVIDANVWFNSYNKYPVVGAYNSTSSAFRNMFHFDSNGAVTKFLASNALDYANDVTRNLMYKNEDSYLSRYLSDEYGADALRFDAGAYLYGTGLTINQITEDLTGTLKSRYPDKLLVCENYTDDSDSTSHLTSGWDTCWNTPMIYWMRGLAEGTQTMSGFVNHSMKNISFDADGKLRIIIERIGDRIIIYTNQNPTVAFNILDTTYTEGYFGFTTSNAEGYFGNYTVFSLTDSWTEETTTYMGSGRITYADNSVRLNANSEKTVALHQKGISYTDVFASVELSYITAENSYAGLSFASTEGTNPFDKGIVIALKDNSTVVVLKDGTEVASALITANSSNQLSVSIKNGKYEMFFNDLITPVLTYYGGEMGGNVGVAAKNVDAAFTRLVIDDISGTNVFDSLGYYKASVNSASKSEVEDETVTLHTPTNSLGYTNNGYSYSIVNNSGLVNTEYFALSSSNFEADGCYEVSGILKSGAYTDNSNMDLYYAITVAFRKVTYSDGTSGYLKLALTKSSGGISIIFDNDYYEANNRKYLKYEVKYDDGTYIRNDNIDNRFRIISDDKTVSVWLNGTLVIDSFDYSAKATNVAPTAGIGYNCCRCNITDFTINKASSACAIIKNVGTNGSIALSNASPTAGENVTITKSGIIASGTFNAYYLNYDKVEKIVAERIGYREDESSVDTYSFVMPDTENPVVITCDFTDDTTANISALGAQYRENGTKADIRFGTRLGYKVTDGIITVSGVDYELIETGTLITTVTALNTVEGTHEELVTLDSESLWGEQHKYIKNVKRTKYYDYCNEYIDFAVSVTGISDFDKVYVARGYVLTKDTSGNKVVFYTDVIYRTVNGVK